MRYCSVLTKDSDIHLLYSMRFLCLQKGSLECYNQPHIRQFKKEKENKNATAPRPQLFHFNETLYIVILKYDCFCQIRVTNDLLEKWFWIWVCPNSWLIKKQDFRYWKNNNQLIGCCRNSLEIEEESFAAITVSDNEWKICFSGTTEARKFQTPNFLKINRKIMIPHQK